MEGRVDPLYHSKYISGFISRLKFEKDRIKSISLYVKSGFAAGKNDQSDISKGIVQIRPTNLDSDGILKFDKNIYVDGILEGDLLEREEILFNNTNSQDLVGKTGYFDRDGDFCCSNHITRIKVNKSKALPKYLKEILSLYQRKQIFYNLCTNWNNQSGVNSAALSELLIPLPPLDVQQQIIDIMDSAYEEKRTKEKQAQELLDNINGYLLDELEISMPAEEENTPENRRFYVNSSEVLGGRLAPNFHRKIFRELLVKLKNINSQTLGKISIFSNETWDQNSYFHDKFPYIEISEIDISNGSINNIHFIDKSEVPSRAKMIVRENDIIISTTRPNRGAISMITKKEHFSIASTGFVVLREISSSNIQREFLFHILRSQACLMQLEMRQSGGNYPAVTLSDVREILIPILPLEKQQEICDHISDIRNKSTEFKCQAIEAVNVAKTQVEKILLGE